MPEQKPSVGRIVHYVSHGSPVLADGTQAYTSECRAAIITDASPGLLPDIGGGRGAWHDTADTVVGLCVLNPTGVFFHQVAQHEGDVGTDHTGAEIPARSYRGGSWHWPERV